MTYPYFIKNEDLPGKYKHIGIEYHRTPEPNGLRYKLFYPSSPTASVSKPKRYFTNFECVDGVRSFIAGNPLHPANNSFFSSMFATMIKFLAICVNAPQSSKKRPLQCNENAPFITDNTNNTNNDNNKKYPLVIFSHGLGGSFDAYSQICIAYASYGFIVAALDHREGSALYTQLADGTKIYYQHPYLINKSNNEKYIPQDNIWQRKDILTFRGPQFAQRVKQFKQMYNYLSSMSDKDDINRGNSVVFNKIDKNHIWAVGHSYGAITVGISVKELVNDEKNINVKNSLKGVIMYDPWAEVATDEMLTMEYKLPSLILYTEQWINDKSSEFSRCVKTLYDSNTIDLENKQFLLQEGFTHQDCSDVPDWGPPKFIQNMGNRSKIHSRKEVIDLFMKPCIKFIGVKDPQLIDNGILDPDCVQYQSKFVSKMPLNALL